MAQCKGVTKSGSRCKNTNGLVDGFCRTHKDQGQGAVPGDDKESESIVTEVAEDINKGVSRVWMVLVTLATLLLFWIFKKKKRHPHFRKIRVPQLRIKPERK